jgi:acyl carrier protein
MEASSSPSARPGRDERLEMAELVEELKNHIIEALGLEDVAPADIVASEPLFGEGLGLDSIDALELVVMVEKHYDIKITDIEVGKAAFESVDTLADFVSANRGK